ncbi:cyclic nucleotide-binding domain-containing protein [Chloroflexota bacterium]
MAIAEAAVRLARFWIFEGFSPQDLTRAGDFLEERMYVPGEILYSQGDHPDTLYLVEDGAVRETGRDPDGKLILDRRVEAAGWLGHRSLLSGSGRRCTAMVVRDSRLLVLSEIAAETVLAMFPKLRDRLRRVQVVNRLLAIPLFASFSEDQLHQAADLAQLVSYAPAEVIFHQGEPSKAFFVIDSGQLVERVAGTLPGDRNWPRYITAGGFIGSHGLLNDTTRRATAEAVTDVHLYRFGADAFQWFRQLRPGFDRSLDPPYLVGHLHQLPLFSRLGLEELKHLAGYVGQARYRPTDAIYRQGELDPTLYILHEGEAIVRGRDEQGHERPRSYLRAGDSVGETSLFLEEPRDVTVESTTASHWFYLTREDLNQYLALRPQVLDELVPKDEVADRQGIARFPWMEHDERFVLRCRRHVAVVISRLILPGVLFFIALLIPPDLHPLGLGLGIVAALWAFWYIVDWTNDYYIVTTKRVAHREKVLFVRETRDETPLDKIQNVNVQQGLSGNMLGYGTLLIDTAAGDRTGVVRIVFTYLPEPQEVQALVFEQMSRLQAGDRLETHRSIRDKLEAAIGVGLNPSVPKPAVPSSAAAELGPETNVKRQRVYRALWGNRFWIEKEHDGEIVWRKHWIRLLARIWLPLVLLPLLLAGLVAPIFVSYLLTPVFYVPIALLALVLLFWLWWVWADWGNDQYIVTDDRIIDTERLPLGFRSSRTETTFDRIQNVNFEIPHPMATILSYGTVFIYTAGAEGRLDFQYVRDPKKVQAEIFRRLTAYEALQRRKLREDQMAELPDWFAVYDQSRRP